MWFALLLVSNKLYCLFSFTFDLSTSVFKITVFSLFFHAWSTSVLKHFILPFLPCIICSTSVFKWTILCFLFILSCDWAFFVCKAFLCDSCACDWAFFVCKAFLCDSCAGLQVFGIVKILWIISVTVLQLLLWNSFLWEVLGALVVFSSVSLNSGCSLHKSSNFQACFRSIVVNFVLTGLVHKLKKATH